MSVHKYYTTQEISLCLSTWRPFSVPSGTRHFTVSLSQGLLFSPWKLLKLHSSDCENPLKWILPTGGGGRRGVNTVKQTPSNAHLAPFCIHCKIFKIHLPKLKSPWNILMDIILGTEFQILRYCNNLCLLLHDRV